MPGTRTEVNFVKDMGIMGKVGMVAVELKVKFWGSKVLLDVRSSSSSSLYTFHTHSVVLRIKRKVSCQRVKYLYRTLRKYKFAGTVL